MDITTPVAKSEEFATCQGSFYQFQYYLWWLLDNTSINEKGIAEEELSSMKSLFHKFVNSTQNDLSSTFQLFTRKRAPVAYFRITFLDFHNGMLLPLLSMYYGTDTVMWSRFEETNVTLFEKYTLIMSTLEKFEKEQSVELVSFRKAFGRYLSFSRKVVNDVTDDKFSDILLAISILNEFPPVVSPTTTARNDKTKNAYESKQSKQKILKIYKKFLFHKASSALNCYKILSADEKAVLLQQFILCHESLIQGIHNHDDVDDSVGMLNGGFQSFCRPLKCGKKGDQNSHRAFDVFFDNFLKCAERNIELLEWF